MAHHLAQHAGALDQRLTDARVAVGVVEEDAAERDLFALFDVSVIDADHIAFFDEVLPRTVFKHCVHGWPTFHKSIRVRWLRFPAKCYYRECRRELQYHRPITPR